MSITSLVAAVEAGRGVALVFPTVSLYAGKGLVLRPLSPAPPLMPVAVVYRKDGIPAAVAAFVAAARAAKVQPSRSSGRMLIV